MLGFTACAWGVATDAEPDLGVLRSLWMKSLFALAAAALGATLPRNPYPLPHPQPQPEAWV